MCKRLHSSVVIRRLVTCLGMYKLIAGYKHDKLFLKKYKKRLRVRQNKFNRRCFLDTDHLQCVMIANQNVILLLQLRPLVPAISTGVGLLPTKLSGCVVRIRANTQRCAGPCGLPRSRERGGLKTCKSAFCCPLATPSRRICRTRYLRPAGVGSTLSLGSRHAGSRLLTAQR